jgi:hypothetical protein
MDPTHFRKISLILSNWRPLSRHAFSRCNIILEGSAMQFALLIYESPEAFGARKSDGTDPYTGAWRAYHKALVEAGVFVGGDPLEVPETGTTIRMKEGKRGVQDGPYADTKEQLGGFTILELPSLDAALEWAARCPGAAYGAVEVRPLAPETKRRIVE